MSRKMAIHNGKLTSNLDANGFTIINAAGGGGGGGGGGTTNYEALSNKPKIGGVELSGNKTLSDLGAVGTNDSRLTNARTPTAHASSHATGGADAITPADIGAAAASHTHTQEQITDFGGPYLPTSGGTIEAGPGAGGLNLSPSGFSIGGTSYDDATATMTIGNGSENGKIVVADGIEPASIKKGGKEVATEEQLPYPIATVTDGALKDRTVNTATAGGSFAFPDAVSGKVRDFALVISSLSTSPSVSFPTTGVSYVSDQSASDIWTAEANKTNVWYFTEISVGVFAVVHKAFSAVTQGS